MKIINCRFITSSQVIFTLEGVNFFIKNSHIDLSRMGVVLTFMSLDECPYYANEGIANNFIMDNCTLYGINSGGGLNRVLGFSKKANVTFINNRFQDIDWGYFDTHGITSIAR